MSNLNYVAVSVIGVLRVASGALSLGEVQAFLQYTNQFSNQAGQIGAVLGKLQSGLASAERVFAFLDADEQSAEPAEPASLATVSGHVEFQDVSFRYRPDRPLIENFSLSVPPGTTVAIVGPTGAGKTTLGNLLMRFYEPDAGRILVDGVDISTMTREALRSRMAGAPGHVVVRGDGGGEHRVRAPRGDARGDPRRGEGHAGGPLVEDASEGLRHGAGRGSGHQRRRETAHHGARAFLASPSVLILDEATSSVDTRSELLVQQAMAKLRRDRTSFVIAHRLSTIRDADLILVMHRGRITEQARTTNSSPSTRLRPPVHGAVRSGSGDTRGGASRQSGLTR